MPLSIIVFAFKEALIKFVTPAHAGVQVIELHDSGVRRKDEFGLVQRFLNFSL